MIILAIVAIIIVLIIGLLKVCLPVISLLPMTTRGYEGSSRYRGSSHDSTKPRFARPSKFWRFQNLLSEGATRTAILDIIAHPDLENIPVHVSVSYGDCSISTGGLFAWLDARGATQTLYFRSTVSNRYTCPTIGAR